ncbi:MAG: thymidine phosphorylase [Acidobacteriota bacterium]|nr:thymidine phosphorylase [Acidobacteriota bacterium]
MSITSMRPQEIIAKKRDGAELSADEINSFIDGVCDGSWADYQISALIMAMFIRGLNMSEQDALTRAMLHSGEVLDFSDIDAPKADKHSTGGVGDKTSLIIAPLVAACGVAVPMISGRGLGHTGGTLDKLEAIPGYNVKLSKAEFRAIITKCGFAMAGQTAEMAPADKKLYALRDATATVPCIPLIVASIMSKKLAEGLDALVLDVKTGSGAFMQLIEDSKKLAQALVKTGTNFGVKTEAVVSDMSQPLGKYVGNVLETYECIRIMQGDSDAQMTSTRELSLELSARLLVLAGISKDITKAHELAKTRLASGEALRKFQQNVELQGGDPRICDKPEMLLDEKLFRIEIKAARSGYVGQIDTLAIGNTVVAIGGGRSKADDKIDHAVGYACNAKIGTPIGGGETLGVLHCRNEDQARLVGGTIIGAYKIVSENNHKQLQLIQEVIAN